MTRVDLGETRVVADGSPGHSAFPQELLLEVEPGWRWSELWAATSELLAGMLPRSCLWSVDTLVATPHGPQ